MNQEILTLRGSSHELQNVLLEGRVWRYGKSCIALPREWVTQAHQVESIIFEIIPPENLTRPPLWKVWMKAIRTENLSITLIPGLAVLMDGIFKKWTPLWMMSLCAFLGVLFFQISVQVLNDVEDHLRLIDFPGGSRGSGVIQKGWLSAQRLRKLGYLALVLGVIVGLPTVFRNPQVLLVVGAVGVMGVLSYSNRPFGVKYRVVGDLAFFALVGPFLTIGFSEAIFGQLDTSILWMGLFFGFIAFGISHAGNLQDIDSDQHRKVSTLAVRIGFKQSRHLLAALYFLAASSVVLGGILGIFPYTLSLTVFLGLYAALRLVFKVYRASGPVSALLGSIRTDAARLHFLLGFLFCLGFLFAFVVR